MYLFYAAALLILAAFVAAGTFIGRASTPRDYSLGGRKSSAAGVTGSPICSVKSAGKCGAQASNH